MRLCQIFWLCVLFVGPSAGADGLESCRTGCAFDKPAGAPARLRLADTLVVPRAPIRPPPPQAPAVPPAEREAAELIQQGEAEYARRNFESAAKYFETALKRDPRNSVARQKLENALHMLDLRAAKQVKKDLDQLRRQRAENELRAECAELSNEEIWEDSTCRCLVHPSDPGCMCRKNPRQPICQVRDPCDVWKKPPWDRGIWIEDYLAQTEYSAANGWNHIGASLGGFFPHIDFEKGNEIWVQVKTIDTSTKSWLERAERTIDRMKRTIEQLGGDKLTHSVDKVVLDIRVKQGDARAARQLVEYGRKANVKVTVTEFQCK